MVLVAESNQVFQITFNRPEKLNALTPQVYQELEKAVYRFKESSARICILRGAGDKAFISGADIEHYVGIKKNDYLKFMEYGH